METVTTVGARKAAIDILMRLSPSRGGDPGYSNILIDSEIKSGRLPESERALFTRLVNGVTERRITLDYIIAALSDRKLSEIDGMSLNLCRMGLYQLIYCGGIPEHAAVSETVKLSGTQGKGFVNAILRAYQRKKDEIVFPDREKNFVKYLSVTYSVSSGLCRTFIGIFGPEKTERILASPGNREGITLRTNTLVNTREELIARLGDAGIPANPTADSPYGIIAPAQALDAAVRSGRAFVQDESSQICSYVLDARPGERVIDLCACPGSKSFSAAMLMNNEGSILSCDLHGSKLPLITSGAKKLGITIIRTMCGDSSEERPEFAEKFDRVICDVPCSGFGVLAKKPEIRYKPVGASAELPDLQLKILEAGARMLKRGGVCVYSTCTLLPAENEGNVKRFLERHPDFRTVPFECGTRSAPDGMLTLTPDGGTDGFFIAKLEKI